MVPLLRTGGVWAARRLRRLWQSQGKRVAAHALPAPMDSWCTQRCDTADLQEATARLDALACAVWGRRPALP